MAARHRGRALAAVVVGCAALFAACGSDSTSNPNEPFTGTIHIRDNFFSPSSVTISAGDSVTWRWEGTHQHSVEEGTSLTNPSPLFNSGTKTTGTFGFRFNSAGTVRYFCRPHFSSGMKGTITVNP